MFASRLYLSISVALKLTIQVHGIYTPELYNYDDPLSMKL